MKQLDDYLKLQKEIFEYFSFEPNYVVPPIEDRREYLWYANDLGVTYAEKREDFETGNCYSDEIYTQRFYDKWIYKGKDFTMIIVDTHTDGNKFLAIYDNNNKEVIQEEI